ncbi:MAG TPA: hypothetical protein VKB79_00315 [Bryobacteraceae bacterium]|nr:hypothetical protein [Bryobacteraceae bacterium]
MRRPAALIPAIALAATAQQVDRKLQSEFDDLSAKAAAMIETVNAMEQRARDNGDLINPAILERRALLQSSIQRAEDALRDKDMGALREQLVRARGHLDKLSRMI